MQVKTLAEPKHWWSDASSRALTPVHISLEEERGPVTVDHVANFCQRYPGETVTFYTRVAVHEPLSDLTLRISLPTGLALENYRPPPSLADAVPYVEVDERAHYLTWSLKGDIAAGESYEYRAQARVAPTMHNVNLESRAVLVNGEDNPLDEETATLSIGVKGRYLRYLPELYESDELMGRFLMLFESFWGPIDRQIASIHDYFDAKMTPTRLLPWLASWPGLELDEHLSEERQRQLIQAAVWLFRGRGTKKALQQYLEIYTGGEIEIVEHRAHDLRLGPQARLGPGIALGIGNQPHTFTITLRLPPISPPGADEEDQVHRERERIRAIRAIIEREKPAHTDYTLRVETLSPDEQSEAPEEPAAEAEAPTDEPERW